MPDPLSVVTTAWDAMKKLRDLSRQSENAEIKGVIADLSIALSDVKLKVAELQEENTQLRKQRDLRGKIRPNKNVYFLDDPPKGYHEGPYCPRCMDENDKLISMHDWNPNKSFHCDVCDGVVEYDSR